jgi:DnaJ-class molecular chaperone
MSDRLPIVPGTDCPVCRQDCTDRAACSVALAAGEWTACLECGGDGRHSTERRFPCPVCGGSMFVPTREVLALLGLDPWEGM